MRWDILRSELADDPLSRGYSSMTDDQVASSLNAKDRNIVQPTLVTAKELMAMVDPTTAASILQKLEAEAANNAVVKWIMSFITGGGDGIDLGHANTRAQIDALVAAGVLTATEGASLKALAQRTVSRAEELGLPEIKPWMVAHVRGS